MLKSFSAVALVMAFAAGPAFAAGSLTATLEKPAGAAKSKVFDGVVVRCEGNTCVSTSDLSSSSPKSVCRQIARSYGPVTAFTGPSGALSAEALAACNR